MQRGSTSLQALSISVFVLADLLKSGSGRGLMPRPFLFVENREV
jgi:hypothetical protein